MLFEITASSGTIHDGRERSVVVEKDRRPLAGEAALQAFFQVSFPRRRACGKSLICRVIVAFLVPQEDFPASLADPGML